MSPMLRISKRTLHGLRNPAPPGMRHHQIVQLAASMVGNGLNAEAIFAQLRPNYSDEVSDYEIRKAISWAADRISPGRRPSFSLANRNTRRPHARKSPGKRPISEIDRFLGGFTCEEADIWERSRIRLPDDSRTDPLFLIGFLFRPGEFVNIVSEFGINGNKPRPKGFGTTRKRDQWIAEIARNGAPKGKAGIWIRPNPTDGSGISDANTAIFRHLLIEFDSIPLERQLPFIARLKLPISAIIASGGKSLHAWIAVNAGTIAEFRKEASTVYRALAPYGLDTANRNPSRLSRLPGAVRGIGGGTDNRQRLLYLNPKPSREAIFA